MRLCLNKTVLVTVAAPELVPLGTCCAEQGLAMDGAWLMRNRCSGANWQVTANVPKVPPCGVGLTLQSSRSHLLQVSPSIPVVGGG